MSPMTVANNSIPFVIRFDFSFHFFPFHWSRQIWAVLAGEEDDQIAFLALDGQIPD